jgi:hypothetical protein
MDRSAALAMSSILRGLSSRADPAPLSHTWHKRRHGSQDRLGGSSVLVLVRHGEGGSRRVTECNGPGHSDATCHAKQP